MHPVWSPVLPLCVGAHSVRPAVGSPSLVRRGGYYPPDGGVPHRFVRFRRLRAAGASPCPTYANDRTARRAATLQRAFCLWGRRTHGCSLRAADSRPYGKTGLRPARAFPLLCVGAHSVRPTGPVLPLCARLWALLPLCVGADSIRPTGIFPHRSGGFRRRESQRFISRLSVRPIR